jgi:hypothetical protein
VSSNLKVNNYTYEAAGRFSSRRLVTPLSAELSSIFFSWIPLASLLVSCASIKTTHYVTSQNYSPREPASVEVLWSEPMAPHEHLGEIVLNDSTASAASSEIEDKLRKEAAKMGADAVIVVLEAVQSASPSFIAERGTHPTPQRCKVLGLAIKYRRIKNDLPGGALHLTITWPAFRCTANCAPAEGDGHIVRSSSTIHGGALSAKENYDFSLVLGGPLYQAYLRCGLARPPIELLTRRIVALVSVTWVPLALLSAIDGHLVGGVAVPFLQHLGAHVRFLLVLPLLVAGEVIVHRELARVVPEFTSRGLVAPEDHSRFNETVAAALRLRDSAVIEVLLLIVAFTVGSWLWKEHIAMPAATWYAPHGSSVTLAGYWYALSACRFFGS